MSSTAVGVPDVVIDAVGGACVSWIADSARTRPYPCAVGGSPRSSAVARSVALTSAGVHDGFFCSSSAATAATCGVAMLVPDSATCIASMQVDPGEYESHRVEQIATPGATMSGFK